MFGKNCTAINTKKPLHGYTMIEMHVNINTNWDSIRENMRLEFWMELKLGHFLSECLHFFRSFFPSHLLCVLVECSHHKMFCICETVYLVVKWYNVNLMGCGVFFLVFLLAVLFVMRIFHESFGFRLQYFALSAFVVIR